ncbi:MAG: hypothetical protein KTR33_16025, partial [Gammaproteobacteria bacterium]|nr:hypothetical protein [Gammaproteobacteria bacterium]
MKYSCTAIAVVFSLLVCLNSTATAQKSEVEFRTELEPRDYSGQDAFKSGGFTLQLMNGALGSPVGIGPDTNTFNYTMHNLRVGYIMNTPSGNGHPLDGAVEIIGELSGSAVFEG